MLLDRSVVLGLVRTVRRDGALGPGLSQLVVESVRRLTAAGFHLGAERTLVTVAPGLEAAYDLDELLDTIGSVTGRQPARREETEDRALVVAAIAEGLGRDVPPTVLELDAHRLRLSGFHVPGGGVLVERGIRDLMPGTVDPLHPATLPRLRERAAEAVAELPVDDGAALALAGAAAALVGRAIVGRRFGPDGPPPRGLHVSDAALAALERELLGTSGTDRLLLPGVDPAEVDDLATTLIVVRAALARLDPAGVDLSAASAVDGLLTACLVVAAPGSARERAVAIRTTQHAAHVAVLAGQLFDALADRLALEPRRDRPLLLDACRLHELAGMTRGHASHRAGAHELLRDGLPGVGPDEVAELACLVRFQTGRLPGDHLAVHRRLPAHRRRTLERLTGILRLACGLDAGRAAEATAVRVELDDDLVVIHVAGPGPLDLSLYGARAHVTALRTLWRTGVVLRASAAVAASPPARPVEV